MTTYYINIPSGSVRTLLLTINILHELPEAGAFDLEVKLPWFDGDEEAPGKLVNSLKEKTSDIIEVYDGDANLVASTLTT